jgi:hypothetical protein
VGRSRIICDEVVDYILSTYLPDGSIGDPIELKEVPVLKALKFNLISERHFANRGLSIIKTERNCWIIDKKDSKTVCVGYLAATPSLYFLYFYKYFYK